ncbi:MAG: glycosyltransferase family 1 protein [Candidatus Omnitrophota bacterium]|jgi:glycosyltransferase involved in cell wall biosynthesis|nr:MAG: glycosyltransferase family 1 protein [Candidatus Omnitrophota bacterium]
MNILFITNHINIGGITSYVVNLGSGFRELGHEVYIASSGGECLSRMEDKRIYFYPIPIRTKSVLSPKILISFLKLKGLVNSKNIDIIHANSRTTQALACLLSRATKVPYVSTCHGFFRPRMQRRMFSCWGKRVIAVSDSVKEHLINDFNVSFDKISLVYSGIDIDRFSVPTPKERVEAKQYFGLGRGKTIGIIARLSDVKGHIYLIEALRYILAMMPEVQLLIVGDGNMKNELVTRVNNYGIAKNVFFVTQTLDTRDVLAAIDIFVMPSIKEGLGLALMEAMACGLPVIGSDIGGIKNLITNDVNGLLFPVADSNALAKAIVELIKDDKRAAKLGERAREFICANFSKDRMARETLEVYKKCLNQKS